MYEVIVETYCMGVRRYAACNAVRNLFDSCYEDKIDAVKAYDDQFEKYYKEHKDCYYSKDDYIFKIVDKKSAGYNVVIRGRIFIKGRSETLPRHSTMMDSMLGVSGNHTRTRIQCSCHRTICQATSSAE